ncbi:helix-turn-helix domain-containing protein [Sphingomonas alba]|nr:helix-turn-helix domain-containing protein [Sphingomonas alba]
MEPIGLSIAETGRVLGGDGSRLSRATIYRMIARGQLEAFKLGSRTLITVASIERCAQTAPRLRVFL